MNEKKSVAVRLAVLKDLDFCSKMDYAFVVEATLKRRVEEKLVMIAEVDGKSVGYSRIEYLWLKIPYIGLIIVRQEYRKKGVAFAMIRFLEEYLIRKGYNVLYSSSQVNEPEPQAWHRKIGFEECGYIAGINEGGIGEVIFRKILL